MTRVFTVKSCRKPTRDSQFFNIVTGQYTVKPHPDLPLMDQIPPDCKQSTLLGTSSRSRQDQIRIYLESQELNKRFRAEKK